MKECSICKKYNREIAETEANLQEISSARKPQRNELMKYQMKMGAVKYALERHRASKECTERETKA